MLQKNPGTPNPFEEHEKGVLARNDYVAHKRVHLVVRILREAGIDQQLEELDQDGRKGPQGGKALLTHFVVLVIMILLAMEGSPLIFENAAQMLHHRLLPETRALLGLTRPTTERRCYFLMQRGFTRFADLFNPMPGPLGKRMTMDEYVENDQNRDDVECAEAMTRLDKFTNDLLWAPINTCPEILDGWDGNVTIDATAFAVFSKKGQSQHRLFASIESDAGWYRRDSKHNVPDDPKMAKIAFWGYELHLVAPTVNTRPSRQQRFCKPVIGISQCKPSHDPAGNGLKALRAAFTRAAGRMLKGLVVADMGYFANATPESLAMPVRAMGMGIVTDYKKDQRGVQDGFAGAVQVDGNWACPAMPPNIKDASADFAYKRIDATTFAARMHSREIYLARRKARPDADGNTTWMCPAAGPQATILCALKPKDFAANQNKTGLLQTLPLYQPEFPDQFCTQGSVKFPPNAGAKFAQDLTYASKLWLWIYPIARNYIESVNAFLKDEHRFALGVAGRRRARGYTKQYLFATILVFTSNLERIDNFIHPDISDPKLAKERRRDITNGYRYDPKTGRGAAPTGIADGYETNEEFITDVNEAIDPDA